MGIIFLIFAMSQTTDAKHVMAVLKVKSAVKVHPTGNPNFSVLQSFPAGLTAEVILPPIPLLISEAR